MAMKGSTLGAYDETDTADYWKQKQQEHSSDDYVDDTPEAYGWVTADVQLKANNLMRTKPENWGDMDAAFADHKDSIKDNQSDHSNNEKYVEDAPSGDYAEAVDYDVLQLEQHLKNTQMLMTLPENWGDLAFAQEEFREKIHGNVQDHSDEDDFKDDAPDDYNQADNGIEYNLQLNSLLNRNYNNILLAATTLPENWGDLAAAQEEYREGVHTSVVDHTDEDDFKDDSPDETNTSEILGAYDIQLKSTLNRNFNNVMLALADEDENGVDTDLHGSDAYENHADQDDYKDDAPAGFNTVDQGIEYEVQLDAKTATLPENWGDLAFNQAERREKLHEIIEDSVPDEDDYKDDSPAETNTAEILGAYDLQLDQQGMSIAEALKIHHPSSDSFVQKWGEVHYDDTPEAI